MGPKTAQHQMITPVTEQTLADQGIAYLKYQQALIFVVPEVGVFNALTVLSLSYLATGAAYGEWGIAVPNVNGRPTFVSAKHDLLSEARKAYEAACRIYFEAEKQIQAEIAAKCLAPKAEDIDDELEIDDE